jgi:hypothetical protein
MKIGDLLDKLQKTGVFNALSIATKAAEAPKAATRYHLPPIMSSNVSMVAFQEMGAPTSRLSDFYLPTLKVRYRSIIMNLHKKRSTCGDCGIYFKDKGSVNFIRHHNEHLQLADFEEAVHPTGKSRGRFLDEEVFLL